MSLSLGPVYGPRAPQTTVLYRVIQEHLETFIERSESGGRELPAFVKREFRRYLECGILQHGFARVVCKSCNHNHLVPYSCKGRGFCPSCCGRRMAETSAHLVDHVFPHVPVRQWVLSLPFDARARVAFDAKLRRVVLRTFIRAIYAWLRRKGRQLGVPDPQCGSVTFEQRFGSDLRINLHFHVLALDGAYSGADGEKPEFQRVPAPTEPELDHLAATIHRRVLRALRRGGWVDDQGHWVGSGDEPSLQLEFAAASVVGRIAQGKRRGARVPPVDPLAQVEPTPTRGRVSARSGGFDLHAAVSVEADNRTALERLCNYISRPPIATDRLELTADGNVRYRFKRPWKNGTTHVDYRPLEFLERLAALVPLPRLHLIHFHGVLAPRSRLRPLVVPAPPQRARRCAHQTLEDEASPPLTDDQEQAPDIPDFPARQLSKRTWSELLRRTLGIDALKCPRCEDGRMRIVSFITKGDTIRKILEAVDLPTEPPSPAPARPPPQELLEFS